MFSLAFSQTATGPPSVCEGSNVTLQCRIVFISADNATVTVQSNLWSRNISGMITTITTQTLIPNHRLVFNPNTGVVTDLVITNVTLEDNNAVYTCSSTSTTITSSVVLNVIGNVHMYVCVHVNIYIYMHMFVHSITYLCISIYIAT